MKANIKHLIWSNDFSHYEEDDIREAVAANADIPLDEVSDTAIWDEFSREVDMTYEDERINLDKPLDGRIIVIADLNLWNGHRSGYKILDTRNLNGILSACQYDYQTVYSDGYNIRANDTHHDGTNRYLLREVREDMDIEILCAKLYAGTATQADINRYTKSLARRVGEIYGWCKVRRPKVAAVAA